MFTLFDIMGIFSWVNRIFSSKEQVEVMVPFRDLEDWADSNTRKLVEGSSAEIKEKHNQILDKKNKVNELLNVLKEAKLKNPNIEPKMLQFMSGNRDNYIQQVSIFINNLPEFNENFHSQFQDALSNLTKKTGRSYQILQEFFANESRQIAIKIKEMNELSKKINELKTGGKMSKVNEIKDKIKEIKGLTQLKENMMTKMESAESKINGDKQIIEKLGKKVEGKKNSDEFNAYSGLVAEREKLAVKLKMLDAEVNELFSPLKRAFKKFRRITLSNDYEVLIDKYLGSPLVGLIDDSKFNVLNLFQEILNKMNSLNLDDREQNRVKQKIEEITREKLDEYRKKYDELKQQLVVIKQKIQQNTILQDIEKLQQEIDSLKEKVKRKEIELDEETKKREAIDIEGKIKRLQLFINENLGTNICIK